MIPIIATKFSASSSTTNTTTLEPSLQPQTPEQWRLALKGVKLLYVQRQYKQCAARSAEIFKTAKEPIHPVYKTYLYFYSAISHEVLGRAAHNYSSNKLHLLHSALDCFVTCNAVLPSTISTADSADDSFHSSLVDFSSPSDSSESPSSSVGSLMSSITRIIDNSMDCSDDDPFVSENDDCLDGTATLTFKLPHNDDDEKEEDVPKGQLFPSPLRIRKPSDFSSVCETIIETDENPKTIANVTKRHSQTVRFSLAPPLPVKIVPAGDSIKACPTKPETKAKSEERLESDIKTVGIHENSTPARPIPTAAITNYNNAIQFLGSQINSSIADIQSLVDEVTEMQRTRRASRGLRRSASFWSFSPVKDESHKNESHPSSGRTVVKETKEQRIARLRAEGWTTVGLKSAKRGWKGAEYYKSFCSSALDELYLDDQ